MKKPDNHNPNVYKYHITPPQDNHGIFYGFNDKKDLLKLLEKYPGHIGLLGSSHEEIVKQLSGEEIYELIRSSMIPDSATIGLYNANADFKQLTNEQILNLITAPNSDASQVVDNLRNCIGLNLTRTTHADLVGLLESVANEIRYLIPEIDQAERFRNLLNVIGDDDENNHNQINELVGSNEGATGFQMRYPYIPNQEFVPPEGAELNNQQHQDVQDIGYYQQHQDVQDIGYYQQHLDDQNIGYYQQYPNVEY